MLCWIRLGKDLCKVRSVRLARLVEVKLGKTKQG